MTNPMPKVRTSQQPIRPASHHHLAVMVWIAVFPTLTVLQVLLNNLLKDLPWVIRTLVLVTIAVPIVVYGLLPFLHKLRARLIIRKVDSGRSQNSQ